MTVLPRVRNFAADTLDDRYQQHRIEADLFHNDEHFRLYIALTHVLYFLIC